MIQNKNVHVPGITVVEEHHERFWCTNSEHTETSQHSMRQPVETNRCQWILTMTPEPSLQNAPSSISRMWISQARKIQDKTNVNIRHHNYSGIVRVPLPCPNSYISSLTNASLLIRRTMADTKCPTTGDNNKRSVISVRIFVISGPCRVDKFSFSLLQLVTWRAVCRNNETSITYEWLLRY